MPDLTNLIPLLSRIAIFFPLSQTALVAQDIQLENVLNSYAWGASGNISNGTYQLNIWDDVTGAVLVSDNGDRPDLIITFSSSAGSLGTGAIDYTGSSVRATQSFSGTVASNNPGSRVTNSMTILFGDHMMITNLNADFTSLNSRGLAWETSRLAALTSTGSYFSAEPTLSPYLSHTPILGRSAEHPGFFMNDGKDTVAGVGTSTASSGLNVVPSENLTDTFGNSYLDYVDLGLASGTRIGGFEWFTVLEDTRGTTNTNISEFTSTLSEFAISGTMVPEPSGLVLLLGGLGLLARRKRA